MIIIIGGLKGGTGKSTIALHLATLAQLEKKNVITYDFDFPQFSLGRFYDNRKHFEYPIWQENQLIKNFNELPPMDKKDTIYIIDTPGRYEPGLVELHKKADIIITPINDSLIDIDTLMNIEKERWSMLGSYYEMIFENKKEKPNSLWLVTRNRSSSINSKHKKEIELKLEELSKKIDFELIHGMKERMIFRELFGKGATVFDVKKKLSISHLAAKVEIKMLWKRILSYMKAC